MAVEIRAFRFGDKQLKTFLKLPRKLYAGDPDWTPELLVERMDFHNPKKQPIRRPMDITYFLAYQNGKPVGRITAHSYPAHNVTHEDKVGFFGFFECINDAEVAAALFDAAAERLKELGFDTMRGPADFCTNEEVGCLVWAVRKEPAQVMMKYNPMYHVPLYEGAGFSKAMDLLAFEVTDDKWPNEQIIRVSEMVRKRGATVRELRLDKKNFEKELLILSDLYKRAWEKNWGFVPLNEEEFHHLAVEMRSILDPRYSFVAEWNGEPVGWAMTIPDLHAILRHTRGGLLRTAWHMFVRKTQLKWDIIRRARIAVLGIVPQFRRRGIEALFYERNFEVSINTVGVPRAEMSWILECNAEMVNGAKMMQGEHYKTYRLFDRAL